MAPVVQLLLHAVIKTISPEKYSIWIVHKKAKFKYYLYDIFHLPKLLYVALQGFRSIVPEASSFSSSFSSSGRGNAAVTEGQPPSSCFTTTDLGSRGEKSSVTSWVL